MIKGIYSIIICSLFVVLISCDRSYEVDPDIEQETWDIDDIEIDNSEDFRNSISETLTENEASHEESNDYNWSDAEVVDIILNSNSISVEGTGVDVSGTIATISTSGNYRISGTLLDGQIVVNSSDEGNVKIMLDNANISNSSSAPLYVKEAEKTVIFLKDGTVNNVEDAEEYNFENTEDDEPNAAIFSKDNLSITGTGSLVIQANYNDGIASKDGLVINNSKISIDAMDDGIRGKDYIIVNDGEYTIDAGGDGMKSDNDEDDTKGYIYIQNGDFNINSGNDVIQAKTDLLIEDGNFNLSTKSTYTSGSSVSVKGLKASVNLIIDQGEYIISSTDDAIHSNGSLVINDGTYEITTKDDAIHADGVIYINNGDINITGSYEGIESAVIKINDGDIQIISSDDGINIAGGNDGSGHGGPGMGGGFNVSTDYQLFIDGGRIAVYSTGDGIDANGYITMTNGTVLIHGPTSNMNSALDFDGGFNISGGLLVAAGSSGMAQSPGSSSSQESMHLNFNGTISGGTMIHIESSDGTGVLTFVPEKNFQSIVFSSPEIAGSITYDVYSGGSSGGLESNGLYTGGTYTSGTKLGSLTL